MPASAQRITDELRRVLDDMRPLVEELAPQAPVAAMPPPVAAPSPAAAIVGRPWSLAAAMAPLAPMPAIVRSRTAPAPPSSRTWTDEPERRRWPLIAAGFLALVALVVFVFATAKWAYVVVTPASPPAKVAKPAAAQLVPVAGPNATGTPAPSPTTHFPDGTATVYVSVRVTQATASPALTFTVAVQAGSETAQTPVETRTFVVTAGEAVVPIAAPSGDFMPGTYTVTAALNGAPVGTTNFVVG